MFVTNAAVPDILPVNVPRAEEDSAVEAAAAVAAGAIVNATNAMALAISPVIAERNKNAVTGATPWDTFPVIVQNPAPGPIATIAIKPGILPVIARNRPTILAAAVPTHLVTTAIKPGILPETARKVHRLEEIVIPVARVAI